MEEPGSEHFYACTDNLIGFTLYDFTAAAAFFLDILKNFWKISLHFLRL